MLLLSRIAVGIRRDLIEQAPCGVLVGAGDSRVMHGGPQDRRLQLANHIFHCRLQLLIFDHLFKNASQQGKGLWVALSRLGRWCHGTGRLLQVMQGMVQRGMHHGGRHAAGHQPGGVHERIHIVTGDLILLPQLQQVGGLLSIAVRIPVLYPLADEGVEDAELAKHFLADTHAKQGSPIDLTIHADNGPAPASDSVSRLLRHLGITESHSRPHVSDDNPYSEALFKTKKYRPDFPDRFASLEAARVHCRAFFDWYNNHHFHTGIALLTPFVVHHGLASERLAARQEVLDLAYLQHPERFVHRRPTPPALPDELRAAWRTQPPAKLLHRRQPSRAARDEL